jgi:uncharacterized membrane protein required for colicin V production
MLLGLASILVIAVVAYFFVREGGLLTGITGCFNVYIAGLAAFQLWPYLANELESILKGTMFENFEDAIALVVVFALTTALLRVATSAIIKSEPTLPPMIHKVGAGFFGAVAGYFVAGFLVLVLQTFPWQEDFLGFPKSEGAGFSDRFLPPDQNFLKLMSRAHRGTFSTGEDQSKVFEEFDQLFATQRRIGDKPPPKPQTPIGKTPPTKTKEKAKPKDEKKPEDGKDKKADEEKKDSDKKDSDKKDEEKEKKAD